MAHEMDETARRFSLLDLDFPTPRVVESPAAIPAPVPAPIPAPIPDPAPELVVKAGEGRGTWGDAEFHNLTDGARASGDVRSAHSLLRAADLEWDPVIAPLYTSDGLAVPSDVGRAVVRSDNRAPIGCVGDRYQIIPHRKLADLADALCGTDGAALHFGNAGHKFGGARPFIQLKSAPRPIGKDAKSRDVEVSDLITLLTSHDGTLKMTAAYSCNVILCDNTYSHALSSAAANGIAIRHTASGLAAIDEAIRIAKAAREYASKFDNAALRLMVRPFDDDGMTRLASALIPGDSTRAQNCRKSLLDAWVSSPGAAPGTAWGAAQAVTFYTSHEISTRGDTDRAFGLATGEGRGADLQAQAWWHLTEEEGAKALQTVTLYRC